MDSQGRRAYRLGIDVGGTFTDLVLLEAETGAVAIGKVLTTPADPSIGVLEGVRSLLRRADVPAGEIEHVIHATTLVGNAIIEHKGARTALVTTRGFRDVLTLRREFRYDIYESHLVFPTPLVPRRHRVEVAERVSAAGQVVAPLSQSEVDRAIQELADGKFEAVAICLLHSYSNPVHERQLVEAIEAALPGVAVSASSGVLAQVGEYERTCATVMNAFVQPLIRAYLARLAAGLRELGIAAELYCTSSNGGLLTARTAARYPIRLLESGSAAGALGASHFGQAIGHMDLLSFDMGGTTAKACLIRDGAPSVTTDSEVARMQRLTKDSGLPIKLPVIDMIEIGAGGGSIARIDAVGLISVGPDSAGAAPGPICYGRGGKLPTVTDANLILGYLNPDYFLGGEMSLDFGAAEAALGALGARADLSATRAAWGVHEIVSQNMANALRTHAIEKGADYRSFGLVAFGGAGPIHAYRIATLLKVPFVIFPWAAGVFSALGLLTAPLRFDLVRSFLSPLETLELGTARAIFDDMERELRALFLEAGLPAEAVAIDRSVDMRYVGQGTEVEVPLHNSLATVEDREALASAFFAAYTDRYGWSVRSAAAEAVNWRASARGPTPRFGLAIHGDETEGEDRKGLRRVYLSDEAGFQPCPVYDRYRLRAGRSIQGPALVEERECTIFVGPDATASVDANRNLVMVRKGA